MFRVFYDICVLVYFIVFVLLSFFLCLYHICCLPLHLANKLLKSFKFISESEIGYR